MFTLEIENTNGRKLKLSQNEDNYQITNITGLTSPKAEIFTSDIANMDGKKFKSSRLEVRNIVLTIKLNGDVEANRIALYDFFDTGKTCKIYYKNGARRVYCEGYCEQLEAGLFEKNQSVQVSILCVDPYWKSFNLIYSDLSFLFSNFEFPFAIEKEGVEFSIFNEIRDSGVLNSGDVSCGVVITLIANNDNIQNPIIYNVVTGEFLKLNLTMNNGDKVIINTNRGLKSICKIVDGSKINIISLLAEGSSWLQLEKGRNIFTYRADSNYLDLSVVFEHNNLFKGV